MFSEGERLELPVALNLTAHTVTRAGITVEAKLIFKTENGGSFSDAATTALIRRMHARQKALDGIGWIDPDKSKREDKVCVITAHGTARSGFRTWAKDDRLGHNRKFDQPRSSRALPIAL